MDKEIRTGNEDGSFVDNLFRKGLEGLSPQPSSGLQERIHRRIFWKDLYTFNIVRLSRKNGFRLLLLGSIILLILFLLIPSEYDYLNSSGKSKSQHQSNSIKQSLQIRGISKQISPVPIAAVNHGNKAAMNPVSPGKSSVESFSNHSQSEALSLSSNLTQSDLLPVQVIPSGRKNDAFPDRHFPYISLYSIDMMQGTSKSIMNAHLLPTDLPPVQNNRIWDCSWYSGLSYNIDFEISGEKTHGQSINSGQFTVGFTHHHWMLETGVAYSYAPDRGNYDVEFLSKDSIGYYYNVKSISVNPSDPTKITYELETLKIFDSVPHTTNMLTRNRYSYLRIPLDFGYTFCQSDRFAFAAMLGGEMLLMLSKDEPVPVFDPENGRISGIVRSDPSRRNNALGILAGIRGAYRPYKNVSLILEPDFKYYVNAFQKHENSGVSQPFSIGVRAGIIISVNP